MVAEMAWGVDRHEFNWSIMAFKGEYVSFFDMNQVLFKPRIVLNSGYFTWVAIDELTDLRNRPI